MFWMLIPFYMSFGSQNFSIFIFYLNKKWISFRGARFLEPKHVNTNLGFFLRFPFCPGKITSAQHYFPLAEAHKLKSVKLCLLGNLNGQMVYRKSSEYLLCSWNCAKFQPELSQNSSFLSMVVITPYRVERGLSVSFR